MKQIELVKDQWSWVERGFDGVKTEWIGMKKGKKWIVETLVNPKQTLSKP